MSGRPSPSETNLSALAGTAYTPVVRGFAAATAGYYAIIALSHPFFETGLALAVLAPLASASAVFAACVWAWLRRRSPPGAALEIATAGLFLCIFANIAASLRLSFDPDELIYFVLLALVSANTAPTQRTAYLFVAACAGGLVWFGRATGAELIDKHVFIGLAGAFAALGMATLMRGAVLRELRARLAAEALTIKAEAANRAKAAFLATISHEVRTPLNGVIGLAQAMDRSPLVPAQRERLHLMRRSAESLLHILNDVLDLSKIEAGELAIRNANFRLDDVADTLRRLYAPLAREKGLRFLVLTEFEIGEKRFGDEERLLQVLSNLVSNALKFTPAGEVVVEISANPSEVVCQVRDTGIGIAAADQEHVFSRFVQVDASATRRNGGTGLGLAICRELTRMMGGRISLSSSPGAGSCFTFCAPMPPARDAPESPAPAPAIEEELDGLRILLADDNYTNLAALRLLLESFGAQVGVAEDGRQALEAWQAEGWDVVLMDIHMPGMDGVQATRAIREAELASGRPRTPVLAVTASAMPDEVTRYLREGLDGAVPKPVSMHQLVDAIHQVRRRGADAGPAAGLMSARAAYVP
ncbi:MAG: ATP-binding protein [Phenylobacterium sp.]|uniref:ATP-binding protein n=1 Tax=Phenylobacterium sp. TaxID=1871053 RepID=UPI00391C3248